MEGASQTVNTTKISTFPIKKIREEVSSYFVRQGKITGPEHYAGTGKFPIRLEGIETAQLYEANRESVQSFLNQESQGYCCDLRENLEELKPGIYQASLLKFDSRRTAWQQGKIGLLKYAAHLYRTGQRLGIELSPYVNLRNYVGERQKIFSARINPEEFYSEIEVLDSRIRRGLYTSQVQEELDDLSRRLDMIEKMINISIPAQELAEVRARPDKFAIARFMEFIRLHDLARELIPDPGIYMLDKYLQSALDFYQVADERSLHFVKNLLGLMDQQGEEIAVLVSGGFHSEHILSELRQKGVSHISINPRLSRTDLINPYFSLLQNRRTPLEKLLAQNQIIFQVESFFWQGAHKIIPPVSQLPQKVRVFYDELSLLFKALTLARALRQQGVVSFKDIWQEFQTAMKEYKADTDAITIVPEELSRDMDNIRQALQNKLSLPLLLPFHLANGKPLTLILSRGKKQTEIKDLQPLHALQINSTHIAVYNEKSEIVRTRITQSVKLVQPMDFLQLMGMFGIIGKGMQLAIRLGHKIREITPYVRQFWERTRQLTKRAGLGRLEVGSGTETGEGRPDKKEEVTPSRPEHAMAGEIEKYFRRISAGIPWELFQRIVITAGILGLYLWGRMILIPGMDPALVTALSGTSPLDIFNLFSGGASAQFSIFALGLTPYFMSALILQLGTFVFPQLKDLKKSGETGQRQLEKYTKWFSAGLAAVSAVVMVQAMPLIFGTLALQWSGILALTLGSVVLTWFQAQLKERGISGKNGSLLLAFIMLLGLLENAGPVLAAGLLTMSSLTLIIGLLAILVIAIAVNTQYIKIPVLFSRQNQKLSEQQPAQKYLRFKRDYQGVMSMIYAMAAVALLSMIGFAISPGSLSFILVVVSVIIIFCLAGTRLFLNPQEITDSLQQRGVYIPGIAPGTETRSYLSQVVRKISLNSAMVIIAMTLLPDFIGLSGVGISIMILVGSSVGAFNQVRSLLAKHQARVENLVIQKQARTRIGRALSLLLPIGVVAGLVGVFYVLWNVFSWGFAFISISISLGLVSWIFTVGAGLIIGGWMVYTLVIKSRLEKISSRRLVAKLRAEADQVDALRVKFKGEDLSTLRQMADNMRGQFNGKSLTEKEALLSRIRDQAIALAAVAIEQQQRAKAAQEQDPVRRQLLENFTFHPNQIMEALAFTDLRQQQGWSKIIRFFKLLGSPGISVRELVGYALGLSTGQGKTEAAALALFTISLMGEGAHLITPNIDLAEGQGKKIAALLGPLGVRVAITGIYDPPTRQPAIRIWDEAKQETVMSFDRALAYQADITFGLEQTVNHDYQNMLSTRDPYFRIDDEGHVPFLVEGITPRVTGQTPAGLDPAEQYKEALAEMVRDLEPGMLVVDPASQRISLTAAGQSLPHAEQFEELTQNQSVFTRLLLAELLGRLEAEQNTRGQKFFHVSYEAQAETAELSSKGLKRLENEFLGLPGNTHLTDYPNLQFFQRAALDARFFYQNIQAKAGSGSSRPGVTEYILTSGTEEADDSFQLDVQLINAETGQPMPGQEVPHGVHQALQAREYLAEPDLQKRVRIRFSEVLQNQSQLLPSEFALRYRWRHLMSATPGDSNELKEMKKRLGLRSLLLPSDQSRTLVRDRYPDQYYFRLHKQVDALMRVVWEHRALSGIMMSVHSEDKLNRLLAQLPGVFKYNQGMQVRILGPETPDELLGQYVRDARQAAEKIRAELTGAEAIPDSAARRAIRDMVLDKYRHDTQLLTLCVINSRTTPQQKQAIQEIGNLPFVVTLTTDIANLGYDVLGEDMLLIHAESAKSQKIKTQTGGRVARQSLRGFEVEIQSIEDDAILQKYFSGFWGELIKQADEYNLLGTKWGARIVKKSISAQKRISQIATEARESYARYSQPVQASDMRRRKLEMQINDFTEAEFEEFVQTNIQQDLGGLASQYLGQTVIRQALKQRLAEIIFTHTRFQDHTQWDLEALGRTVSREFSPAIGIRMQQTIRQIAEDNKNNSANILRGLKALLPLRINELSDQEMVGQGFRMLSQALAGRGLHLGPGD
ncbi:hypothetical protein KAR10_02930, partial [bacterium]|nr:hypothetical protein [bacterium]